MDVFLILVLLFYSLNFFTALKTNFELSTLDNLNLLITSIKSAKLVQEDFQHISIVPTYLIRKYMTPKILSKTVKSIISKLFPYQLNDYQILIVLFQTHCIRRKNFEHVGFEYMFASGIILEVSRGSLGNQLKI